MRASSYRKKPDENWQSTRSILNDTTLYLVHRCPTVFNIRNENGDIFRITIGNPHTCSCGIELCVHFLFIMLKVLRIPEDNPMCWQSCFTDSEINNILNGNIEREKKRPSRVIIKKEVIEKPTTTIDESNVPRQPIDDQSENICPICQDDMIKGQALTWCRKSCGNNIHAKCMKMFAQFKISNNHTVSCPLCREEWGPQAIQIINDDMRDRCALKNSCATIRCLSCTLPVRGTFYRCLECSQISKTISKINENTSENEYSNKNQITIPIKIFTDFCERCFQSVSREHSRHHFVSSDASTNAVVDVEWTPAKNPRVPSHGLDVQSLLELQDRELSAEDYDILLGLDGRNKGISLPNYILESLTNASIHLPVSSSSSLLSSSTAVPTPPISTSTSTSITTNPIQKSNINCCYCNQIILDNTTGKMLSLCKHVAHSSCILAKINEAMLEGEGCSELPAILCGVAACKANVFPCLSRRRARKKTTTTSEGGGSGTGTGDVIQGNSSDHTNSSNNGNGSGRSSSSRSTLGITITGLSVSGVTDSNNNNNNNCHSNPQLRSASSMRPPRVQRNRVGGDLSAALARQKERIVDQAQLGGFVLVANSLSNGNTSTATATATTTSDLQHSSSGNNNISSNINNGMNMQQKSLLRSSSLTTTSSLTSERAIARGQSPPPLPEPLPQTRSKRTSSLLPGPAVAAVSDSISISNSGNSSGNRGIYGGSRSAPPRVPVENVVNEQDTSLALSINNRSGSGIAHNKGVVMSNRRAPGGQQRPLAVRGVLKSQSDIPRTQNMDICLTVNHYEGMSTGNDFR
eukprot:gene11048-23099_t